MPVSAGQSFSFTALQPDGKILANNATVRYNADGSLDPSYSLQGSGGTQVAVTSTGTLFVVSQNSSGGQQTSVLTAHPSNGSLSPTQPVVVVMYPQGENILIQPDDKVIVWSANGNLTVGGVVRNGIARLSSDGSLDASFDPGAGPNAGLTDVALQPDGKFLVTGYFSKFDNIAATGMVRLNPDGTVDGTFSAAFPGGNPVPAVVLALPGGKVLAWEGIARKLYRLNPNGSIDVNLGSTFGGDDDIYAMALQPDGKVLVGGGFATFAGQPYPDLVRLNSDGSIDSTLNASQAFENLLLDAISSLAVQNDGKILFSAGSANGAVRLLGDGSPDPNFAPGSPAPGQVIATAKSADGRTFVAGSFLSVAGASRIGLSALLPNGSVDSSFVPSGGMAWTVVPDENPATLPSAQLAVAADGSVLVAGRFNAIGLQARSGFARFLPNGALDSALNPSLNSGAVVTAVTLLTDGRIVIGGSFTTVDGAPRSNLAAFAANGSLDPAIGANGGTNAPVSALVPRSGGGFLVGGAFTTANGSRRDYVAAMNPDGSLDPSFSATGVSAAVTALVPLFDGRVVALSGNALLQLAESGAAEVAYNFSTLSAQPVASFVPTAVAVDASGRAIVGLTVNGIPSRFGIASIAYLLVGFDAAGNPDPDYFGQQSLLAPALSLTVSSEGSLVAAGTFGILFYPASGLTPTGAPVLTGLPQNPVLVDGAGSPTFSVTANGAGLNYQWRFNGQTIPGATGSSYTPAYATAADEGTYSVIVTNSAGADEFTAGTLTVTTQAWLANLSARADVQASPNDLIAGFSVNAEKNVLIRGIGPELAKSFNLPSALPDPKLTLYAANGIAVESVTNWDPSLAAAFSAVFAFPLTPGSNDTAMVKSLPGGSYTADVTPANGQNGVGLAELYDDDATAPAGRLTNLSARAFVGTGSGVLIGGFVIAGSTAETVLLRGVGPELAKSFGLTGAIGQPVLSLYDSSGKIIAANLAWGEASTLGNSNLPAQVEPATAALMAKVFAFPLTVGSSDDAMVVTLQPGSYTAMMTGVGPATGTGLLEIYEVR